MGVHPGGSEDHVIRFQMGDIKFIKKGEAIVLAGNLDLTSPGFVYSGGTPIESHTGDWGDGFGEWEAQRGDNGEVDKVFSGPSV